MCTAIRSKVTSALVDRYFDMSVRAGNRASYAGAFPIPATEASAARIRESGRADADSLGRARPADPARAWRASAARHRRSRLVMFPGLGHVPQEEDPAITVAAAIEFLNR